MMFLGGLVGIENSADLSPLLCEIKDARDYAKRSGERVLH